MPDYKVITAEKTKDHPDKGYGPMQTISLTLDVEGEIKGAEWYAKATTPIPQAGTFITGTLENDPKWGLKFKKTPAGGFGGGGPRPEDPRRSAMILRQHSQHMTLLYFQVTGKLPATWQEFTAMVDQFDADAKKAGDAA